MPGSHTVVIVVIIGNRKQIQANSKRNLNLFSLYLNLLTITDNYSNRSNRRLQDEGT